MTQSQLERAVADQTGESVQTIRSRGFSLVAPLTIFDPDADELTQPQMVDWDQLEAHRYSPAA